jgi:hypothetical protein
MTIVTIVEGDGEVGALPVLLRRLVGHHHSVHFVRPKNAHTRNNLTKPGGLERFLELARSEGCDGALVLLDADKVCAAELAWELAERARDVGLPFPVAIVCVKCEYEAWFLASLETIKGRPGIPAGTVYEGDVESKPGVKEWLTAQMPPGRAYKETQDQAPLSAMLDLDLVRQRSRSFRRLEHAVEELLAGVLAVSPQRQP